MPGVPPLPPDERRAETMQPARTEEVEAGQAGDPSLMHPEGIVIEGGRSIQREKSRRRPVAQMTVYMPAVPPFEIKHDLVAIMSP